MELPIPLPADHPLQLGNFTSALLGTFESALTDIARRRAVDGDSPRLHGFGDLPDQFDLEQPVVEGRVLDLDVVGQVELPLRHWSVV